MLKKSSNHHEKNQSNKIIKCNQENIPLDFETEVPGSMVLGGIEIIGGVFVCILPVPAAKQIGSMMIGDGIRRTFNGLEEVDKINKNNQSR